VIFAGFSFNDVTLTAIADEIVGRFTYAGPPRHVAILALSDPYNEGMRREYLETFHAEVLFYPAPAGDHSALIVLLESLARPVAGPAGRNDAESALQIAEQCEYAWAERKPARSSPRPGVPSLMMSKPALYASRAADLNRRLTPAETIMLRRLANGAGTLVGPR
jgi:hypothetical protein